MSPLDLGRIKAAEQAELRRQGRRERWRRRLKDWEERIRVWERRGKRLAVIGSVLSGLATGFAKLHGYIERRRVPAAELPATGQPTIAPEFVSEPKKPGP